MHSIQSYMISVTGIKSDTLDVTTSSMLFNYITNIYVFVCLFLVFLSYFVAVYNIMF